MLDPNLNVEEQNRDAEVLVRAANKAEKMGDYIAARVLWCEAHLRSGTYRKRVDNLHPINILFGRSSVRISTYLKNRTINIGLKWLGQLFG